MQKIYYEKFSSIFLIPLIGAVIFMLSGCYSESDYSGDGQLKDNGSFAATDRYVLNLGNVDLNKEGTSTYRISNLPVTNFVVGIDFSVEQSNLQVINDKDMNPTVSLTLSSSDGKTIFKKEADLARWTWSLGRNEPKAFIYGRDEDVTYFDPKPQAEYVMKFTVLKIDSNKLKHRAVLKLKSSGWK